jgi:non-ribosomal peptide synthase protein (TIGR01720 family)
VGWFTTLYPVLLEMEQGALDIGSQVKSIKEQLGKLPDKGLSYGVLKYLHKDQSVREHLEGECWDVVFNYLGQTDNVTGRKGWLKEAEEDTGEPISEANIRREKLEIVGIITGGRLRLSWGYSKKQYESATISAIAVEYTTHLQQIIAHCVQKAAAGISEYTPSDYGMGNELTCHELDKLLKEYAPEGNATVPKITGIYRLSGVQMGILFHRLYDSNSSAYIVQMSCDIKDLEVAVFIKSWEYLIRRHSILRTGFHYEGLRVPVQCVYESVNFYVQQLDYRFMEEKGQAVAVTEYLKQDQVRPFSFREVPLMRLSLLRIGDRDYKMVWTFHHILLDGWSVPVLMEEFLGIYEKLIKGNTVTYEAADNYDDYIKYLEQRNKKGEEQYWRTYLSGVSTATFLPMVEGGFGERTKGVGKYGSELLVMNDAYLKLVKDYVNRHQITINTLMQGVWGYLLSRYADSEDVLYGVTVSGRPEELEGIEQRVGMYINTFPVRIKIDHGDEIGEWLAGIQRQQVLSRKYQYSSLSELSGKSGFVKPRLVIEGG